LDNPFGAVNACKQETTMSWRTEEGRSVIYAWLGVFTTVAAMETAQLIVSLVAGILTVIYTSMKILDWVKQHQSK
jgi:voltage-gated potassium channel Kch